MGSLKRDDPGSSPVSITVLSITPVRAGKLFALASAAIEIDGVQFQIHGIRASRVEPVGTKIELPVYRDAGGVSRAAITLPDELRQPLGDIVLDALVERGLAAKRFRATAAEGSGSAALAAEVGE